MLDTGEYSLVEYTDIKDYYSEDNLQVPQSIISEMKDLDKNNLNDGIANDGDVNTRGTNNALRSSSGPISLIVYSYGNHSWVSEISNYHVAKVAMHTWNALKGAYGSNRVWHKVKTHFKAVMDYRERSGSDESTTSWIPRRILHNGDIKMSGMADYKANDLAWVGITMLGRILKGGTIRFLQTKSTFF